MNLTGDPHSVSGVFPHDIIAHTTALCSSTEHGELERLYLASGSLGWRLKPRVTITSRASKPTKEAASADSGQK